MQRSRLSVFIGVFGIALAWLAAWGISYAVTRRNFGRAVDLAIALPPKSAQFCLARAALASPLYALALHALILAAGFPLLGLDRAHNHPFALDKVYNQDTVFAPVYARACAISVFAALLAASIAFAVAVSSASRVQLLSPGKSRAVEDVVAGLTPVRRYAFGSGMTAWAVVGTLAAAVSVAMA
jgi:hypothetical protein